MYDSPRDDKGSCNIFFEEDGLPHEVNNLPATSIEKRWLGFIEHTKYTQRDALNTFYDMALRQLPGSYILWYNYLKLLRSELKGMVVTEPAYEEVNRVFERSLIFMYNMPRMWVDYLHFLNYQGKVSRTRRVFDRALKALPIAQHGHIWPFYCKFIRSPETPVTDCRKHVKVHNESLDKYISFLISIGRLDDAVLYLADVIYDENLAGVTEMSTQHLWNQLCDLIVKNPHKIIVQELEPFLRQGLKRFTDQRGMMRDYLTEYYIRGRQCQKARDMFEEAIQTVTTVQDFTQVFNAYVHFEKRMVDSKKKIMEGEKAIEDDDRELKLILTRLQPLMDRRPLLLNSVRLHQSPHLVPEWHRRVSLFEKHTDKIKMYTEAVQRVDPNIASGRPHTLWVALAKLYATNDQIEEARRVFEKATQVSYQHVDDLACVWCEWAEMELRHDNIGEALKLMQRPITALKRKMAYGDKIETVQDRLHKSLKVWSFYADLEECFGTFKSCKDVYEKIINLQIATPQTIMNYAAFLEENNHFDEAFRAYEKGISLFKWPNVFDLWKSYLTKCTISYERRQLEQARRLFEICLEQCPEKFAKEIYILYAWLERKHGMPEHAMAVYERATRAVLPEQKYEMFQVYIKRAAQVYGVSHARPIYKTALASLPTCQAMDLWMWFDDLENKYCETDIIAPAISVPGSQISGPIVSSQV